VNKVKWIRELLTGLVPFSNALAGSSLLQVQTAPCHLLCAVPGTRPRMANWWRRNAVVQGQREPIHGTIALLWPISIYQYGSRPREMGRNGIFNVIEITLPLWAAEREIWSCRSVRSF